MTQTKLTAFMAAAKQGDSPQQQAPKQRRPAQARLDDLRGVVRLPKMPGHASEAELARLLSELSDAGAAGGGADDQALIQAMRQLACYEVTVQQLEAVPLGKRVKQLRQHSNPEVSQQAVRLLAKLRSDVAEAVRRQNKQKKTKKRAGG